MYNHKKTKIKPITDFTLLRINMLAIILYIKERFPVSSVLMFAFGFAALTLGLSSSGNIWAFNTQGSIINLFLLSSVFFFFLLRQRAIDEFRDSDHDLKYFPDRPVPRGLVSKKQVLYLGLFALAIEVISAYLVGQKVLGLYLFVFLYSLLMAKDFFIPRWLDKHFTTYFLIHEVIFLLFGVFFVVAASSQIIAFTSQMLIILAILTFAPMSIEVLRKFKPRYDKAGKAVKDTYSTVWGRSNALLVLIGLSLTVGLGLTFLKQSYIFVLFSLLIVLVWITIGRKSDTGVIAIGAINFLGFAILANIIW